MLLGAALLLTGCSLLSPKDKEADAMGIDTSGPAAFALEVDAPKDIRELLEKHLELKRFRYQPDLQRRELTRLLGATDANVRELIGTLGYFSPTVTVELTDTPDAAEPRKVVVKVDPGPPTIIEESKVGFTGVNAKDELGRSQRLQIEETWPLDPGEKFTQSAWSAATRWPASIPAWPISTPTPTRRASTSPMTPAPSTPLAPCRLTAPSATTRWARRASAVYLRARSTTCKPCSMPSSVWSAAATMTRCF